MTSLLKNTNSFSFLLLQSSVVLSLMVTVHCASPVGRSPAGSVTTAESRLAELPMISEVNVLNPSKDKAAQNCEAVKEPLSELSVSASAVEALALKTNNCLQVKNFDRGEKWAQALVQLHPFSPWGFYYLSLIEENRGHILQAHWMIDSAFRKIKAASHAESTEGLLYYQRARLELMQKKSNGAYANFTKALERLPSLYDAHLYLGRILILEHDDKSALGHFKAYAAANKAADELFFTTYTRLVCELESAAQCVQVLELALETHSKHVPFIYSLGETLQTKIKDLRRAVTYYQILNRDSYKSSMKQYLPNINIVEKVKTLEIEIAAEQKKAGTLQKVEGKSSEVSKAKTVGAL
jgi:tetratricopeptide (TPR) repeat protein